MSSRLKLPDARVIIIGNTQVGKTTLLARFIDKTFTSSTSSTVTPVFSPGKVATTSGGEVSMQLWDTAGQERYQSVGQVFYRNANYAVICFDCNDPEPLASITKWKDNVLKCEPKCAIYLAATKSDLFKGTLSDLINKGEDLKTQVEANDFFVTSALTGDGVESLFGAIADHWENCLKTMPKQKETPKETVNLNESRKSNQSGGKEDPDKKCC